MPNGLRNVIFLGDCLTGLRPDLDESVHLLLTSPPYANQRPGGIHPDRYVDWFLPRSAEFMRVLKPEGSFILNIKENVVDGERHGYVDDLVEALRGQGWLRTETYIWVKTNCSPGWWPNRFRDAWEYCFHFTKRKKFSMYQDEVKVPIGDWAKSRLARLSEADLTRSVNQNSSRFATCKANWVGRELVYPSNVLILPTECGNKNHNAVFPEALPAWFIRLFTERGELVLDPFLGSGTTAVAAKRLGRHYLGVEKVFANVRIAGDRLAKVPDGASPPRSSGPRSPGRSGRDTRSRSQART
jgi:site-specific DNA-methyltransferase (adenine-specific)